MTFQHSPDPSWIIGALTALTLAGACATAPPTSARFQPHACTAALSAANARCGVVEILENYDDPAGRQIALNVVVLPALEGDGVADAQFEIDGGPGLGVSEQTDFYVEIGAAYRRTRDIVFVDMRGTGGSNPLRCPEIEAYEAADAWAPMYPPELVARCAAELRARADLSQYTTANAARDLDSVRAALGYDRIVITALSYGTTLALAYIAEYPERVRAAALIGVAPAEGMPPRLHAPAARDAFASVLADCAADSTCARAYPDPPSDYAGARERLSPERADVFMEWLRTRMYAPSGARRVPLLLRSAAAGDFSALRAPINGPQRSFADGLYLSITCAESFPHFDVEAARATARATPFGDYRLRRQQAACAQWPVRAQMPPQPARGAATPILLVSGSLDPVTPPQWADGLAARLSNARHIVLPGSGHIFDGMSGIETCLDPLLVEFLNSADPAGLDTRCVAEMRPPAFATE